VFSYLETCKKLKFSSKKVCPQRTRNIFAFIYRSSLLHICAYLIHCEVLVYMVYIFSIFYVFWQFMVNKDVYHMYYSSVYCKFSDDAAFGSGGN